MGKMPIKKRWIGTAILAIILQAGAERASAQDEIPDLLKEASCFFRGAADLSDSCQVKGRRPSVVLGLHYGSLFSDAVVVEILRKEVTPEKLDLLASKLSVELVIRKEDGNVTELELKKLKAERVGDKLVFLLGDKEEAGFFIATLKVGSQDGTHVSPNRLIQEIFGNRAIGVMSARSRNP